MILVVDPTVLYTKRGQAWVNRADLYVAASVLTSDTFLQCLDNNDGHQLGAYRPRAYFGFASLPPRPMWLQGVDSDGGAPSGDVTTRLTDADPGGRIATDLWHILKSTEGRNAWLVAQRMTTLDQFVQAGVRLIVEGREEYLAATREIERDLGTELANEMVRCARFLVSPLGQHEEFSWSPRATLVVYDRGTASKR